MAASLLLVFGASAQSSPGAASDVPDATSPLILDAVADTYIDPRNSSTNYGDSETLVVGTGSGDNLKVLLQFDLSTIPYDAVVTSAQLRLTKTTPPAMQQSAGTSASASVLADPIIVPMVNTDPWDESTVTYGNRPGVQSKGDPGQAVSETPGVQAWDVTASVLYWFERGFANHGFQLKSDASVDGIRSFVSREGADSDRPELVIEYEVPEPTATPTTTPTPKTAELQVDKLLLAPEQGQALVRQEVEFKLLIRNRGDRIVTTLPVIDTFDPSCLAYLSAEPLPDSVADGQLMWNDLGWLAPGERQEVRTVFSAVAACDPAINRVAVNEAVDTAGRPVPPVSSTAAIEIVSGLQTYLPCIVTGA